MFKAIVCLLLVIGALCFLSSLGEDTSESDRVDPVTQKSASPVQQANSYSDDEEPALPIQLGPIPQGKESLSAVGDSSLDSAQPQSRSLSADAYRSRMSSSGQDVPAWSFDSVEAKEKQAVERQRIEAWQRNQERLLREKEAQDKRFLENATKRAMNVGDSADPGGQSAPDWSYNHNAEAIVSETVLPNSQDPLGDQTLQNGQELVWRDYSLGCRAVRTSRGIEIQVVQNGSDMLSVEKARARLESARRAYGQWDSTRVPGTLKGRERVTSRVKAARERQSRWRDR